MKAFSLCLASCRFNFSPAGISLIAGYAILLGALYYPALSLMIGRWNSDDYTYCYFIPFVIAYLVWEKRAKLSEVASRPSWMGVIPFGLGIILYWLGELGGEFFTLYISSWLVVLGLTWLHLGWEKLKGLAFGFFLLLTTFPLPNYAYNKLSFALQLLSSKAGAALIQLWGIPVHREGNIIDIGVTQLQVIEACNGIRYLMPLIVLGIILAYFFKAAKWKRALLLLSTIPLAIAVNALRIALSGIFGAAGYQKLVEGFYHDLAGWVVFMFSFAILVGEMRLLGKIFPSASRTSENAIEKAEIDTGKNGKPFPWHYQSIVALALLGATLGASQGIDFREKTPAKKTFAEFPLQVGEWRGSRQAMEPEIIQALHLSDYILSDFVDKDGKSINFYVAYYESQRKGESIHTPGTCLPGSGWAFEEAGLTSFATPGYGSGSIRVSRAYMQKLNSKQLTYYWFPQRGRVLTEIYQLKLYAFWDALTKQRTDGALVRLVTPVGPGESIEKCDERLQGFTRKILPILDEYIPGK